MSRPSDDNVGFSYLLDRATLARSAHTCFIYQLWMVFFYFVYLYFPLLALPTWTIFLPTMIEKEDDGVDCRRRGKGRCGAVVGGDLTLWTWSQAAYVPRSDHHDPASTWWSSKRRTRSRRPTEEWRHGVFVGVPYCEDFVSLTKRRPNSPC
jgi:hypothetical protein